MKTKIVQILIRIFLVLIIFANYNYTTLAYPYYPPNSDQVVVAPYSSISTGAGNLGAPGGTLSREFFFKGHKYRIRQNGTVTSLRLYTASKQNMTGCYFKVWRSDGANYDLVGTSENIVDSLVAGSTTTISLSQSISNVEEGDWYGLRVTWNGGAISPPFTAWLAQPVVTLYHVTNAEPSADDFDWESQSSNAGSVMPIEIYMTAPTMVAIGDSIMMGRPPHYSYLMTTIQSSPETTIEYHLRDIVGWSYQNMAIGAQKTTEIAPRFTNDVVNLKPKIALIEGGVNDIANGGTYENFINSWTSMLDACEANDIIPIVLLILPWSNGTNNQMQTRDTWNAGLVSLASGYSDAIIVDAGEYVGQFRGGGDPGNLWDIRPEYDADGVHFNSDGHAEIAQAIADNLPNFNLTTQQVTNGEVGLYYEFSFEVENGTPAYNFTYEGGLPPGLSLSSSGVLSGIPTEGGIYSFSVTATESSSEHETSARDFTMLIISPEFILPETGYVSKE